MDYIAAKRDDNKSVELETVAKTIPLDFQCGHVNYDRWGCENIAEARFLEEKPVIYHALVDSEEAVCTDPSVMHGMTWPSSNLSLADCGKHQHLFTKDKALTNCYLTAHFKVAVTAVRKQMCGMQPSATLHKEATTKCMAADETTVQDILHLTERMTDPFSIEPGTNPDRQLFVNIAMSTVAPPKIAESLYMIREDGTQEMKQFVTSRLQRGEVDFFDPIKRHNLKSSGNLNKTKAAADSTSNNY
ncbi:unnamed protein product [Caretta caretta]